MNAVCVTTRIAVAVGFAMTLGACGGSGSPSTPSTPAPTPPPAQVRSVIASGNCSGLDVNFLCVFDPFTTSQKGDLDVTVDWTFPEDNIQVMVSSGNCTIEQINAGQCTFITSSLAATTPKPRVLTVKAVAAGTYTLYVGNRGPKLESVSTQIGLTTPGSASSTVSRLSGRAYRF